MRFKNCVELKIIDRLMLNTEIRSFLNTNSIQRCQVFKSYVLCLF